MTMRRAVYRGTRERGRKLLEEAPFVHLAGLSDGGEPVLRTLDAAILDDALVFHGSPLGEKTAIVGRRVVAQAEKLVAHVPSYFTDPKRACPATTLYESVQVHGTLEEVTAQADKARALEALMTKLQPEGGYVPLSGDDPLYAKALESLLVIRLRLDEMDVKTKLAQNRSPGERAKILEGLWRRGHEGDAEAIERIQRASPPAPPLSFLVGPEGTTIAVAMLEDSERHEVAALLRGQYWLEDVSDDVVSEAYRRSPAVVCARSAAGELVGAARGISDGRVGWIYDVIVHPRLRRKKLGAALIRTLLDHPGIRSSKKIRLRTLDAEGFYATLGFRSLGEGFMERAGV